MMRCRVCAAELTAGAFCPVCIELAAVLLLAKQASPRRVFAFFPYVAPPPVAFDPMRWGDMVGG